MKCNKCGYDWSNSGDSAHVCGPVKVKQQEQGEPEGYVQTVIEALYENSDPVSVDAAELLQRISSKQELGEPVATVVARQFDDGTHAGNHLEWRGRNEANDFPEGTAFYTTPQQRTWVGLTAADRKEIERQSVYVDGAIRMTEAKLKEKNCL